MFISDKKSQNILSLFWRNKLATALFGLSLIGLVGWWLWGGPLRPPLQLQLSPVDMFEILRQGALQIQGIYEKGDIKKFLVENPQSCFDELGSLENVDPLYLRCNPNYLQCYFEGRAGEPDPAVEVLWKNQKYKIRPKGDFPAMTLFSPKKRFYSLVNRSLDEGQNVPLHGVYMELSIDHASALPKTQVPQTLPEAVLPIILEDSCHMSYLPQRTYAYGSDSIGPKNTQVDRKRHSLTDQDFRWDNFGRYIYVDKFLVTGRDIVEWKSRDMQLITQKVPLPTREKWAWPVTDLNWQQMRAYCSYRGKQLMTAQVYDAATFWPGQQEDPFFPYVVRGPWPWTNKVLDFSLYKIIYKGEKFSANPKDCALVYTKDCEGVYPYKAYSGDSSSWMQMNQILGGPLEAMRNPLHPQSNLRASSWYFEADSPWHLLGRRAQWDGERPGEIDWKDLPNEQALGPFHDLPIDPADDAYKIGFRCMRYVEEGSP